MKSTTSYLSLFFSLFLSFNAFAGINDEFEALKDSGVNFQATGTICEEVARLKIAQQYQSPQYTVVTGIAYGDNRRTIGELDVIVFENKSKNVVRVGEVKCWKDMSAGLKKAREQRKRFLTAIKQMDNLHFESTADQTRYDQSQFVSIREFISIAQKGSKNVGYDAELDYSLSELMQLRARLIECQGRGKCAGPR